MERIVETLPWHASEARIFEESQGVKSAMSLLYEDILDFDATIIDSFTTLHSEDDVST